jgi:hypothetical protein
MVSSIWQSSLCCFYLFQRELKVRQSKWQNIFGTQGFLKNLQTGSIYLVTSRGTTTQFILKMSEEICPKLQYENLSLENVSGTIYM